MEISKISFIGLGATGQPMASNIVRKGSPITVYDIDATRMEPVVALGAGGACRLRGARSGPYADKDSSALLEYACEPGGVETPRLPADIKPGMT